MRDLILWTQISTQTYQCYKLLMRHWFELANSYFSFVCSVHLAGQCRQLHAVVVDLGGNGVH